MIKRAGENSVRPDAAATAQSFSAEVRQRLGNEGGRKASRHQQPTTSQEPYSGSAVRPEDHNIFVEEWVRILVVEDDPLVREFVVEAPRDEGFEVIHASNGEQALHWWKAADVLIADVKLPGTVDGWQIAELCRERDPDLPVIYATGFSPVTPRPVPGSRILQKPYHPDEIVQAVRELGRGRQSA
ncbi:response regulator [Bradyrhizobium sp. B117]|uniref:response regulator transcription factor n=1 Tax=Bradyrhizobium sp. B117 TaxID=3140246 RepID=UPI0031846960